MASTTDSTVAATWPKLTDQPFTKVVVELGQVSVQPAMGPDASQLDGVFGTRAGFLVLCWILDSVVAFGYSARRTCTVPLAVQQSDTPSSSSVTLSLLVIFWLRMK